MAVIKAKTPFGPLAVYDNDHIGKMFICGEYYEKGAIDEILKQCGPRRRLAIDIGANYGAHSVAYGQKFEAVISFEPQRHLFELLQKNLRLPSITAHCRAYEMAVGHKAGEVSIEQDITEGTANYGSRPVSVQGEGVEMRTLDSFEFDGVDLIKIDVEGAEGLVLYGAMETIRRWQPILFFEFNKFSAFNRANNIPQEYDIDILHFLFHECQYRQAIRLGKKNILCVPKKQH